MFYVVNSMLGLKREWKCLCVAYCRYGTVMVMIVQLVAYVPSAVLQLNVNEIAGKFSGTVICVVCKFGEVKRLMNV